MAATLAIIGSLVLIFSLAEMLGQLRTPDTREQVEELLSEPPGSGLGLEVGQVVDAMRILVYVAAALAAAIFVLAIYVLQRHRGARIALTVAAVLLLFTTPVAGLMPMLVGIAAALLWSNPARDWFAGRVPTTLPARRSDPPQAGWGPPPRHDEGSDPGQHTGSSSLGPPEPGLTEDHGSGPDIPPVVPPAAPGTSTDAGEDTGGNGDALSPTQPPPADRPFGADAPEDERRSESRQLPAQAWHGQQPEQRPHGDQGWAGDWRPAYPPAGGSDRRPWTVTLAAVLTWLGAAVTSTGMLAFLAVLAFDSDMFVREFDRAAQDSGVDLSSSEVLAVGWAVGAMFMLWSLTAAVLAFMAFRRSQAGRIGLVVSAAATVVVSLLAILSIVSLVTLLMAGATIVLLFTGGANAWYSRRDTQPPYPGPGGTGGPGGHAEQPGGQQPPPPAPYGQQPYPPQPPKEKVKPW